MERVLVTSARSKLTTRSRAAAYLHPAADAVSVDLLSLGAARRWKEAFYDEWRSTEEASKSPLCASNNNNSNSTKTVRLHWAPGSRDLAPLLAQGPQRSVQRTTTTTTFPAPTTADCSTVHDDRSCSALHEGIRANEATRSSSSSSPSSVFIVADWRSSTYESIAMSEADDEEASLLLGWEARPTSSSPSRVQWLRTPSPTQYHHAARRRSSSCYHDSTGPEDALSPIRHQSVDCLSAAFGLKSFVSCCGAGRGFEAAMSAAARTLKPKGRLLLLDFDRNWEQALGGAVRSIGKAAASTNPTSLSSLFAPHVTPRSTSPEVQYVYMRQPSLLSSTLMSYAYYTPSRVAFPSIGFAVGRYRGDPVAEDRSVEALVQVLESCGYRDVTVEALSGGAAKMVSAVKGDAICVPLQRRENLCWWREDPSWTASDLDMVPGLAARYY